MSQLSDFHQFVIPSIVSRTTTTPPLKGISGSVYLVPDDAGGVWVDKDGFLAIWRESGWYYEPVDSVLVIYVQDEQTLITNASGVWEEVSASPGSVSSDSLKYSYWSSGNSSNSLVHLGAGSSVGDVYRTDFFDTNLQESSGTFWKVAQVLGSVRTSGLGDVVYDSGNERLVLQGERYDFEPIPETGNVLDLRKVGILGGSSGQHSKLDRIFNAARRKRYVIKGDMFVHCTETVDARWVNIDDEKLVFRPHCGGLSRSSMVGSFSPSGFVAFSGQTTNLTDRDGNADTTNILVRFGKGSTTVLPPDTSDSYPFIQRCSFWGDGQFMPGSAPSNPDTTLRDSSCGVTLEEDDSPNSIYEISGSYYNGFCIKGSVEKLFMVHNTYSATTGVYIDSSSSADTLRLQINGSLTAFPYEEGDNVQTSVYVDFNFENSTVLGTKSPIWYRNGKKSGCAGSVRSLNGSENGKCVEISKSSGTFPVAQCHFDDFKMENCKDTNIYIEECREPTGNYVISNAGERVGGTAVVFYGSLGKMQTTSKEFGGAVNLIGSIGDYDHTYALQIGDSTHYPRNVHLGTIVCSPTDSGVSDKSIDVQYCDDVSINVLSCYGDLDIKSNADGFLCEMNRMTGDIVSSSGSSGKIWVRHDYSGSFTDGSSGGVEVYKGFVSPTLVAAV